MLGILHLRVQWGKRGLWGQRGGLRQFGHLHVKFFRISRLSSKMRAQVILILRSTCKVSPVKDF